MSLLRKCVFCGIYTLKERCVKCGRETKEASYKFVRIRDAPRDFKKKLLRAR